MVSGRAGFTLVELLTALAVGMTLTAIAMLNSERPRTAYALSGAERALGAMGARARAHAVEMGEWVRLDVDPAADSVWVSIGGEVVTGTNVHRVFGVDLLSPEGAFHLCFTPRGFAEPSCSSSPGTHTVTLSRSAGLRTVTIQPLGQMEFR